MSFIPRRSIAIPGSSPVTVALRVAALGNDMLLGGDLSVLAADEAEDLHGVLLVP